MYILLTRRYDGDFRYALAYFSPMAVKCGAHLRQAKLPFAGVSDVFFSRFTPVVDWHVSNE